MCVDCSFFNPFTIKTQKQPKNATTKTHQTPTNRWKENNMTHSGLDEFVGVRLSADRNGDSANRKNARGWDTSGFRWCVVDGGVARQLCGLLGVTGRLRMADVGERASHNGEIRAQWGMVVVGKRAQARECLLLTNEMSVLYSPVVFSVLASHVYECHELTVFF